jgi:hypothetical protein
MTRCATVDMVFPNWGCQNIVYAAWWVSTSEIPFLAEVHVAE